MNETKKNFLLEKEQQEVFETLTDEEAGILIKGIFKYLDTNDSGLTGMLKAIFIPIKNDIDKNEEKYQKKCEILKQNRNHAEISMKSERNQTDISSDNNHISYNHSSKGLHRSPIQFSNLFRGHTLLLKRGITRKGRIEITTEMVFKMMRMRMQDCSIFIKNKIYHRESTDIE